MQIKELREKTIQALRQELIELRQEQLRLRMQKTAGEMAPKPHLHKAVRCAIAQVKTLLKEREQTA